MTEATDIRVLIADDHPVFRDGLVILLGRQPGISVVGSAESGTAALELCRAEPPDVLLVDLRMRQMDGVAVVEALTREQPAIRTIILSAFDPDDDVYRAMRAGAAGYLVKSIAPEELADAIRTVHRGEKFLPPSLAAKLADHVSRPHLTERQDQVLQLIAEGLSNQEIAQRLGIMEGTVKAHVKSILSKLGARDRTQAISIALHRGIVRAH